jgi:hypothetical protein
VQARCQGLLQYQAAFADQQAFTGIVAVPEAGEEGEERGRIHPEMVTETIRKFETRSSIHLFEYT